MTTTPIDDAGVYCGGCGYDLRGSAGERCPECGLRRDAVPLALPWERRADLGRVTTFVRTAWRAAVRPGSLARLMSAGADVRSAQQFRLIVLAVVWVAATTAFVFIVGRQTDGPAVFNLLPDAFAMSGMAVNAPVLFWSAGAMVWPVLPVGLAITLWVGTTWDHWFAWRSVPPPVRGRAMVAGRYAVAPLLGVLVVGGLTVLMVVGIGDEFSAAVWRPSLVLTLWVSAGLTLLLSATAPARMALAWPGGGAGRAVAVLAGTAVQWIVAIGLGLAAFPVVVGFFEVVVESTR